MGSIYIYAERVVIWLGPPVDNHEIVTSMLSEKWTLAKVSEALSPIASRVFENILSQSWWTRVWVVQETARARKEPRVCLGPDLHVGLFAFARLVQEYGRPSLIKQVQVFLDIRERTRLPPRMRDSDLGDDQDRLVEAGARRLAEDLLYFIDATRTFQATDPRDTIFALWTLVRGTREHRLRPDYSMSLENLYIAVTAQIIMDIDSLSILDRKWSHQRRHLPSWVPDYSRPPAPFPQCSIGGTKLDSWNTGRDGDLAAPLSRRCHINERNLLVTGVVIDTISQVTSPQPLMNLPNSWKAADVKKKRLEFLISQSRTPIHKLSERLGASVSEITTEGFVVSRELQEYVRRTSSAGDLPIHINTSTIADAREELRRLNKNHEELETWRESLRGHEKVQSSVSSTILTFSSLLEKNTTKSHEFESEEKESCDQMQSAWRCIESYLGEVRIQSRLEQDFLIFRGETGFQGFGSEDLRNGDFIALIEGYDSPCVLRRLDGGHSGEEAQDEKNYAFHGRCFVHAPEGEAWIRQKLRG